MIKDLIDCYADVLYLKTMLRLPPRVHDGRAADPAGPPSDVAPPERPEARRLAPAWRRVLGPPVVAPHHRRLHGSG